MALKRFGVSLEDELLEQLDSFVKEDGYANRSQAIRFLIEKNLAEKKWQCNHIVAGTIFIIYDPPCILSIKTTSINTHII